MSGAFIVCDVLIALYGKLLKVTLLQNLDISNPTRTIRWNLRMIRCPPFSS